MDKTFNILIVVATIAILGFIMLQYSRIDKLQHKLDIMESNNHALNDTLKVWKDKSGRLHSEISNFQVDKAKDFLNLVTKDEKVKELQKALKENEKKVKNGGSVTRIETVTKFDTVYSTKIDKSLENVVWQDSIKNKWINSKFGLNKGKTNYSLTVNNTGTVVIGIKSNGWFKKDSYTSEFITDNPYTASSYIRSVVIKDERPRIKITPALYSGYGVTWSNGKLINGFQVGAGLNFSLK